MLYENHVNKDPCSQKPRRVWDALTGKYFVMGAGTASSASLINN